MNLADFWIQDLPQQFQRKPKMEILIRAFARQLYDIEQAFRDIREKTDIDTAFGKNLDVIVGGIVGLSRKDAAAMDVIPGNEEITDEKYRSLLRYKILQNTGECTYYDIMDGIELIGNAENVKYSEDPARPATYILNLGERNIEDDILSEKTVTIKAAGVKVLYVVSWISHIMHDYWRFCVNCVIYESSIPFFGSVRKFDGSWALDGTYLLDASAVGIGQVEYLASTEGISWQSRIEGACELPHRLKITSSEIRVVSEAAVIGTKGNTLSSFFDEDSQEINSQHSPGAKDDIRGLLVEGSHEKTACAKDFLVSENELYAVFFDDGIKIYYDGDAEFSIEMATTITGGAK